MSDLPRVPLLEDDEFDSSDSDVYQEDNLHYAYLLIQADDNGTLQDIQRDDVEPTQVDASLIMQMSNPNPKEQDFTNESTSDSSFAYSTKHEEAHKKIMF